ncbi:MAG: bifunctional oligoribonuclease/PAP phosphatase NrnA [Chloroflexi bacterium]|nr:bifunctional oligoribonuclease/PAP phosphatase NrnA [Chloroflexota bacterium]
MKREILEAQKLFEGASTVLVTSHQRPDGDAIGSLLALHISLKAKGFSSHAILAEEVPERYRFLPQANSIQDTTLDHFDLIIAVDCADRDRVSLPQQFSERMIDLNIDHHPTNTNFATTNLVDPDAAATTQMLQLLLPDFGLPLTAEVRTNLLAGLITDTLGFRTDSVTPRVLRAAADLLEEGAPLAELYHLVLTRRKFDEVRYWGQGLSSITNEDGLVWTVLDLKDRELAGYTHNDDADLVDVLTTIDEAKIAIIFVEQSGGKVKISFRARAEYNVSNLAKQFGGGGHRSASGAMLDGQLGTITNEVLTAARELLYSKSSGHDSHGG